ncbi:radical SAM family heme chaperone HemW [Aquirufa sp. ROCK-SH2]
MHLYLHIPFCKQACHYCDFHFSTQLNGKEKLIKALLNEIDLQANYLQNKELSTIYFGGGTPSLLNAQELDSIFNKISKHFNIAKNAEISLEANPEDLSISYLTTLKNQGINRLSIGIQSFNDKNLTFLHRNHSGNQALEAIKNAQDLGLSNISIDLIFGIPSSNLDELKHDIQLATNSGVQHISAYSLTIEPKTVFGVQKQKKIFQEITDSEMAKHFELTHSMLTDQGFEAYEISNFTKNGAYSKHNTSYWMQEEYLGIGPSAHSFNGGSRQWNVSNNIKYIQAIENNELNAEIEKLSEADRFNEYIMTRLRTKWGIDLAILEQKGLTEQLDLIQNWQQMEFGEIKDGNFILNLKGKLIADRLSSDIFLV